MYDTELNFKPIELIIIPLAAAKHTQCSYRLDESASETPPYQKLLSTTGNSKTHANIKTFLRLEQPIS